MAMAYHYRGTGKLNLAKENLDKALKRGATPDVAVLAFLRGGAEPNIYGDALNYIVGTAILFSKEDIVVRCVTE
jgi:hypothetical protein